MRFKQLIEDDKDFRDVMNVPAVIPELSSNSVLCTEWVPGVHIDKVRLRNCSSGRAGEATSFTRPYAGVSTRVWNYARRVTLVALRSLQVAQMPQKVRDAVGTLLLQLTLRELFQWRFMQTDPNWGNFLYDEAAGKLHLIDFGAAREFPIGFVDNYLSMVCACAERNKKGVIECSTRLGFLTGAPSLEMEHLLLSSGHKWPCSAIKTGFYECLCACFVPYCAL